MIIILTQYGLLAVNEDAETLINLLITVIMIAIWLAGSMMRTKGKTRTKKRPSSTADPKRDLIRTASTLRTKVGMEESEERLLQKLADEQLKRRSLISDAINDRVTPPKIKRFLSKKTLDSDEIQQEVSLGEDFGHIEGLDQAEKLGMLTENIMNRSYISDSLLPEQWDADDVSRAILYQEILGPPVGLRQRQ